VSYNGTAEKPSAKEKMSVEPPSPFIKEKGRGPGKSQGESSA